MFSEKIWLGDVDLQIKLHLENRPNSSTKCLSKYVSWAYVLENDFVSL